MLTLTDIITRGQAAFEATLPEYARSPVAEPEPARVNITLTDERQREICLACPLADCVDVTDARCPIRIEQLAEWRRQRRTRQ